MEKVNSELDQKSEFYNIQEDLNQAKEKLKKAQKRPLFYLLLGLILIRPSLDFFSDFEFQIHPNFPILNINSILGGIIFIIGSIFFLSNLKKVFKTPLFWPIIFFLGLGSASIFYSYNSLTSLTELIRISSIFLLYFMAYRLTANKKDWHLIISFIFLSYIIPALFALIQQFLGLGMMDQFGGFKRIFGTFAHPNLFAFYSFFILGLAISFFLAFKKEENKEEVGWSKIQILFFIILTGGLLFFTYTRSAYAAFLIFILIIGLIRYKKILLIGLLSFLAAYLLSEVFQERIWNLISLDPYGSVIWRFRLWRDIFPIILWQPWFGHGLGVFNQLVEYLRGYTFGSLAAHNDYLKITTENGLIGLAAYLWIFLATLKNILTTCLHSKISKTMGIGILAIFLSLIAASSFDNILRTTALQWNLWILIAAWLKINRLEN